MNVDSSLTTGEPCKAPCWQGLIPGLSTKEDALSTLDDLSFVDASSVKTRSWSDGSQAVSWEFAGPSELSPAGDILIGQDGIISSITITPAHKLVLNDLIEIYGRPNGLYWYTVGSPEGPQCIAGEIVWLEQGLTASTVVSELNMLIGANVSFVEVMYSRPVDDIYDYYALFGVDPTSANYMEWNQVE